MKVEHYNKFKDLFIEFGYNEKEIENIWDILEQFDNKKDNK